jgi:predicted dehydrogenase
MTRSQSSQKRIKTDISRRNFLAGSLAAATAFTIVPRYVLGGTGNVPPSEKLNIASIGCGGMGAVDIKNLATQNIVALCDVDDPRAAKTFGLHPNAKKYKDFRVMLEKEQNNIDAVSVSTPDHAHALQAMMAVKMGKHVYCQKPLCHDLYETRKLTEEARKQKVVTQMGTQIHATNALKMAVEVIKSGTIGNVREVHIWSNKKESTPLNTARPLDTPPVPQGLDWDLWLAGSPYRPYNPIYVPFKWRAFMDFGCGRLGDMACHIMDVAWWALDLDAPKTIEAMSTPCNGETYPHSTLVRYEFGQRGNLPPVTMNWYDGGIYPWEIEQLEPGRKLPSQGGLYIGDKGVLLAPHCGGPRLIPETAMKDFVRPQQMFSREHNHWQEFIAACKGQGKTLSNFDYAGPLTEAVLLGILAMRAGKKLDWDSKNLTVTNCPEANELLRRQYRPGYSL